MESSKDIQKQVVSDEDFLPYVQPNFVSIKWRFLLYYLLITLLPLGIIVFAIIHLGKPQLESLMASNFKSRAEYIALLFKNQIEDDIKLFKDELHIDYIRGSVEKMAIEKSDDIRNEVRVQLNELKDEYKYFSEIYILDPVSGKIVVSSAKSFEGMSFQNKDFFLQAKKDFFQGTSEYSNNFGKNILAISMPIKDINGDVIGILAGNLDYNSVLNLLPFSLGKTATIYAVENKSASGIDTGIRQFKDDAGIDKIEFYNNFPEYGITLIEQQEMNEVYSQLPKISSQVIILFLVILIVDLIIIYIISSNIIRPILHLTDKARKIQNGDMASLSDIESDGETDILSRAFNSMAKSLISTLDETKNIINTMPNALFIIDTLGFIKSANESAIDLTEYSKDRLIGKNLRDLLRYTNSNDEINVFNLNDIKKFGKVTDIQLQCFTNSHHIIPISLSGTILHDNNRNLTGYIIIIQDLRHIKQYAKRRLSEITPLLHKISLGDFSEKFKIPTTEDEFTDLLISLDLMADNLHELIQENQQKTEQINKSKEKSDEEKAKAEAFLGSIGESIIAINFYGDIILINPNAERMFGVSSKDVLNKQYQKIFNFYDEKGNKILPDNFPIANVILTKKPVHTVTYFANKNGTRLPLSTTVSPILLENKILGVIGIFRDITKEMEVDKAKSEFVSLASHQLRTPLSGINWLLQEIQRKGNLDSLQDEYLNDALKSNERMVRLVNDLLNVSRLETGIINVNKTEVNLSEFINDLVKEARLVAKGKNQNIEFRKSDDDIMIWLDKILIGQVVTNLLSNAMNYTDKDKNIKVNIRKVGDKAEISVQDEGVGISKDDQEKLFTKFYRTRQAAKYSTTGSGLGLYIIKKIMDISDGEIHLTSEEGKGTTFIVTLPLKSDIKENKNNP